ncbi:hypothetical protein CBR_g32243 [Chara braunii]|uniref:EF-hand domain-containing protein n=1 Tax=Chara braunii TaxID=69332 RepID=A0A388JN40_CHABU|nr:hypothetical protein CBR_g32243 [Chara braunii]|eukprot:GBG59226.1 hypothetical protein CBR_g32243 [Chara braunii]
MADQLNEEELDELREAFRLFDKDGEGRLDGKIAMADFGGIMHFLGKKMTPTQIEDLIMEADPNRRGWMEFWEFLEFFGKRKVEEERKRRMICFKAFDSDHDGTLTAAEVQSALARRGRLVTLKQAEAIIRRMDVNGDGQVSLDEFLGTAKENAAGRR